MSKRLLFRIGVGPLALALLSLAGCGQSTVSGTVTVDGKPLEKGQITFRPEDAGKRPEGGAVENGKFTVKGLAAGKYKVGVAATTGIQGASASMGDSPKDKTPADPIPPGTKGNNETVDITGSAQTVDVKLTTK
jgi:hypothetical protein